MGRRGGGKGGEAPMSPAQTKSTLCPRPIEAFCCGYPNTWMEGADAGLLHSIIVPLLDQLSQAVNDPMWRLRPGVSLQATTQTSHHEKLLKIIKKVK